MPESITTGISSTMAERSRATSCVCATLDISSPNESASSMYITLTMTIQNSEPASGTPSTKRAISSMVTRMAKASNRYGTALAMITISGRTGDTSSTSIVPRSFSRTMLIEVIMAQISISNMPMMAGTKLYAERIWGLYNRCWVIGVECWVRGTIVCWA